jgi:gluconolactonase
VDNQHIFDQIFAKDYAEIISDGHVWTEGPTFSEKYQALYFSDVPEAKIWRYKDGAVSLMLTNSGDHQITRESLLEETHLAEPGTNGLFVQEDTIYMAQHKARRIVEV